MTAEYLHPLFVYGTLKRGYWNHCLLEKAEFIGDATTGDAMSLRRFPGGRIPFVVEFPRAHQIEGELYKVTAETLAECDRLEGHPRFYRRKLVTVRVGWKNGGKPTQAWIYLLNDHGLTERENIACSGRWPEGFGLTPPRPADSIGSP